MANIFALLNILSFLKQLITSLKKEILTLSYGQLV